MGIQINRVAVLGAGVMGQGIAAHLANAGIPSYLFDIAPNELTGVEEKKGLTLDDRAVKNRFSDAGMKSMLKSKPALLYRKAFAKLVTPCNYSDDTAKLGECDMIIEVVLERLDVKQKVFAMVDEQRKPGCIVTSNTSGLSVADMAAGRSEDFRKNFMVTHFFNPVRYLRLLEMVPGKDTDMEVYNTVADWGENVLGKGIVHGKDTPNFVANRIGVFGIMSVFHWIKELGVNVSEADKVFGPALGRAKSAIFRTADVVGNDTLAHVIETVYDGCADDPWRDRFIVPDFMKTMIASGNLGSKSGAGFYKKTKVDGKKAILALNLETGEYEAQPKPRMDCIGAAYDHSDVAGKVNTMVWYKDTGGQLAWKVTAEGCLYAAHLLGEIADDIVNIDRGLRWGFNNEAGPFESWDFMGVAKSVERMKEEGMEIPAVVESMLAKSEGSWYVKRNGVLHYWCVQSEDYVPVPIAERLIFLPSIKERETLVKKNQGASIYDMGDGVALLEFHTKMNSIDADIAAMVTELTGMVNRGDFVGAVVGNDAVNFSVGANIGMVMMAAMMRQWDQLGEAVSGLQNANMSMKYCKGPIVTAPRGMVLGGGLEVMMHGTKVRACGETYLGLVEVGVGVIPAGGGCKELMLRRYNSIPDGLNVDLFPFMQDVFMSIGTAKVATSAQEGRELGYLRDSDAVTINPDAVLADAKDDVLGLVKMGYRPPLPASCKVPGSNGIGALNIGIHTMKEGHFISEYDQHIGKKLAHILCGGDVPTGTVLTEQQLLDLEREAFISLCGEQKTIARIQHMLEKGKPLRN